VINSCSETFSMSFMLCRTCHVSSLTFTLGIFDYANSLKIIDHVNRAAFLFKIEWKNPQKTLFTFYSERNLPLL